MWTRARTASCGAFHRTERPHVSLEFLLQVLTSPVLADASFSCSLDAQYQYCARYNLKASKSPAWCVQPAIERVRLAGDLRHDLCVAYVFLIALRPGTLHQFGSSVVH
jgi:hypothetical protein